MRTNEVSDGSLGSLFEGGMLEVGQCGGLHGECQCCPLCEAVRKEVYHYGQALVWKVLPPSTLFFLLLIAGDDVSSWLPVPVVMPVACCHAVPVVIDSDSREL